MEKICQGKTVAILYVCTGKYEVFWKKFYLSFEKFFLNGYKKEYFVFTDAKHLFDEENNSRVHRVMQENLGWPGNTLMRYEMFGKYSTDLNAFDYIFFMNANAECVREILPEEIIPEKDEIVVVQHPGTISTPMYLLPFERNSKSTAYVPYKSGKCYVAGGINGGTAKAFLEMVAILRQRTQEDLNQNIIAIWHDESQINRYVSELKHYKLLCPAFCYPEGWNIPYEPAILIREKSKYFSVEAVKKNRMKILRDGIKRHAVYYYLRIRDILMGK